jgi:hypothetical protein
MDFAFGPARLVTQLDGGGTSARRKRCWILEHMPVDKSVSADFLIEGDWAYVRVRCTDVKDDCKRAWLQPITNPKLFGKAGVLISGRTWLLALALDTMRDSTRLEREMVVSSEKSASGLSRGSFEHPLVSLSQPLVVGMCGCQVSAAPADRKRGRRLLQIGYGWTVVRRRSRGAISGARRAPTGRRDLCTFSKRPRGRCLLARE